MPAEDRSLLDQFERSMATHRGVVAGGASPTGGGQPPQDHGIALLTVRVDALDKRLDTFDKRLDRLDTRLDGIDDRLRGVETTLAGMNSNITLILAQMPKLWHSVLSSGALVTLILGLLAVVKAFHLIG